MKITWKIFVLLAAGWSLVACAGGKKDAVPTSLSPQTPPAGLSAGPGGAMDLATAQRLAREAAEKRPVRKDEFAVTLVADSSVAQIDAINVDVISADAKNAARLVSEGPVKYRDSRISGGTVKSHTFHKGGTVTIQVPSITPADSIVLWAEIAAPAKGSDTRMLELPLQLDRDPKTPDPVANPITVKLTANGWQREN